MERTTVFSSGKEEGKEEVGKVKGSWVKKEESVKKKQSDADVFRKLIRKV